MKREVKVEGLEHTNPNKFGGMCSREVALPKGREINFDEGIETIATTDAAVTIMDWDRWQVVREVLPMKYVEMPNNDKVPLLDTHSRDSVEKIKGSARNFRTEGGNLLAKVFISATQTDIREKIKEGHLDSVSIGYMTDPIYTIEIPKGKEVIVDGSVYRNEFEDGIPLLVRTWWKAHELSLVPIGADQAAKFKAAHNTDPALLEKIASLEKQLKELTPPKEKQEANTLTYHEAQLAIAKRK